MNEKTENRNVKGKLYPPFTTRLCADKNVVDGDVHKLHKVADEAHDSKADCCANDCLAVLCVLDEKRDE